VGACTWIPETMIAVLSFLLPAALAVYCIYQAVKRPIFLLGIPFLQVMRESIFFGTMEPFWVPGRFGTNGPVLIWVALAWAWSAFRSKTASPLSAPLRRSRPGRVFPEEYLLAALAALALGKLYWAAVGPADTSTLLGQFAPWALLIVGYWFVREAVRCSRSEDVAALLLFVAVATGIASVLFILHQALRVPIYHVPEYLLFTFRGQVLSRTYLIMSPFLLLALIVGLARRSWSVGTIVLIFVSLVAVVVSYTRNLILAAAAVILVVLAARLLKERRAGGFLRRLSTIGAVVALTVIVLLVALPTPTGYFLSRMGSLTGASTVAQDQNLLVRQSDLRTVTSTLWESDQAVVGAPFGVADDMSRQVAIWIPDSTWVGVEYWTGFLGVAIVAGMFLLYGMRAWRLFMRSHGTTEFLGLAFLAAVVATFINSLTGWSVLDSFTYPMGFWLFAFIAGEATKTDASATRFVERLGRREGRR
jgi:hypothetical protein